MRARIRFELYIANNFRGHHNASIMFGLLDFWCPHGSPPYCWVDVTDDDRFEDDAPSYKATASEAIKDATFGYKVTGHQASQDKTLEDEVSEGETSEGETSGDEALGDVNTRSVVAEDEESQAHQPSRDGHVNHVSEADQQPA